jgi:hypothetical protein
VEKDRRDIGASLDQKNSYRSSLKKSDPPVCQTRVPVFHRENLCSNDFPKMIYIFRHDVRNRYKIYLFQQ